MVSELAPESEKLPLSALPQELVGSTEYVLASLGALAKARANAAFESTGYNPCHYSVLALLDEGTRNTQAEIADTLQLDRSQLVGYLDTLEEAGLIERHRDPSDRRRHAVSLTAAGSRQLARFHEIAKSVEDDFLAPLNAGSRSRLHALLLRLAQYHNPGCALRESG